MQGYGPPPAYGPQPMMHPYGNQLGAPPMSHGASPAINIVVQNTANAGYGGGGPWCRIGNKSKGTAAPPCDLPRRAGPAQVLPGTAVVLGLLYLIMCWTFLPAIVGFLEGLGYLMTSDHAARHEVQRPPVVRRPRERSRQLGLRVRRPRGDPRLNEAAHGVRLDVTSALEA